MSGGFHRHNYGLLIAAALAAAGGLQALSAAPGGATPSMRLLGFGPTLVEPGTPAPIRTSSNLAKLRDLNFLRGRRGKRGFKGVSMSVAEGKRRARKARNRQRHRRQWKRWHR